MINEISIGVYSGIIGEGYNDPAFLKQLEGIKHLIAGRDAEIITAGRNQNAKIILPVHGSLVEIAVKSFGQQSAIKDLIDGYRGSKAKRTWIASSYLVSKSIETPSPIGFLDRRQDGRLIESYFLATYVPDITTFKDELIRLFRYEPQCEKFMALMQRVADAVRKMHDSGFLHNDLGNQNILLYRTGDAIRGNVQFIDLNRARIRTRMTDRERARDISRIYLPSDLMRVFKEMYFAPAVPSADFMKWEKIYRKLYAVHSGTRWLRHPLRTRRNSKLEQNKTGYPSEKNMWIWDERSGQPISVMRPADRSRYYGLERHLQITGSTLLGIIPVWAEYSELLKSCYKKTVNLKDRIGLTISPRAETSDKAMMLLEHIGAVPVMVRFYAHESEKEWGFLSHIVKTLHNEGHSVSVALVQDRASVVDPRKWALFVAYVLERVSGHVEYVETGHAVNRVKWGIWNFDEHRRLLEAVAAIADKYPEVKFIGPAVIDFEYHFLMAALRNIPEKLHFASLSHHLYVDRRGAPENRQVSFTALEKFALARAIAYRSSKCDDSLIVSEVNWPLKGTGVYSPVGSPYNSPGPRFNDPSVSEDEYADYMIRYIVIAVCSGMVDRVYWWRLVAKGYGLVDDSDDSGWRKRPAYLMLQYFLSLLGESEFYEKPVSGVEGIHLYMFRQVTGQKICLAYSSIGEIKYKLAFECSSVRDACGNNVDIRLREIVLSGRPIYISFE